MKYFLRIGIISQLLVHLLPFKSVIAYSTSQNDVDNASNHENLTFSNEYSIARNIEVSQKDSSINFTKPNSVHDKENKENIFELILNLKPNNFERLIALLVISTILIVIILAAFISKYLFKINWFADGAKVSPVEHLIAFLAFFISFQSFLEALIATTRTENLSNKFTLFSFFSFYPFIIIFLIFALNIIFKIMFDLSNILNVIIKIFIVSLYQAICSGFMTAIIWYFGSRFETLSLITFGCFLLLFLLICFFSFFSIYITLMLIFTESLNRNPTTGCCDMKVFSSEFWKIFVHRPKNIGSKIITAFKIIINPRRYKDLSNDDLEV